MVLRGKVDATFMILNEARYALPACDELFLLCASGCAYFKVPGGGQVADIEASHFLRASNVDEGQAVVIANQEALLVVIAIRVMG